MRLYNATTRVPRLCARERGGPCHVAVLLMFIASISGRRVWADGNTVSAGLMGGLAFPSVSSGAFEWGVGAAYHFLPSLWGGVFYYSYGLGFQTNSGTSSLTA